MTSAPLPARLALAAGALLALASAPARAAGPITIRVEAGEHEREGTPLHASIPRDRLGPAVREALASGPVALTMADLDEPGRGPTTVQLDIDPGEPEVPPRATWILPRPLPAGATARFSLDVVTPAPPAGPWTLDRSTPGAIDLKSGARPVFRYNTAPVSSPKYKEIQDRDAYLHPAYTPSGTLITGDFSSAHPHHRGFFLAYAAAQVGDAKADFWNIHTDKGKIFFEALDLAVAGPVSARIVGRHRWDIKDGPAKAHRTVLRERWEIEALPSPDPKCWMFDLTSRQQAADRPVTLTPYRYGGMAYRGPDPFLKGTLDVLTSEGKHRKDGDQKPARWVDLTGPIADGSPDYAGAMIAEHPTNPHAPTVVRIHPTTLPFFSYVPAHDAALELSTTASTTFRYRVLIHDGRPDRGLDERVWRDFAHPPRVVVEPVAD
ncbi:PmoA family protein [Tundrisphaera sp. TA3]|uniref:DUF6807 domain-containing protein n=1 Tax=Tundrisphaera sp. TA3 TaxID=3435775 RepID=UPI003EBA7B52